MLLTGIVRAKCDHSCYPSKAEFNMQFKIYHTVLYTEVHTCTMKTVVMYGPAMTSTLINPSAGPLGGTIRIDAEACRHLARVLE